MNTWSLSWTGLRIVTGLELRQRIRSRRWLIALAAWFIGIGGITTLVIGSVTSLMELSSPSFTGGPLAFGLIVLFVLGMGLVIAPTFSASSINGDRAAGVLATLQATRLSALEIAAGKLVAAWLTSAVFLVVALPFIIWTTILASFSWWQVAVCFAVVLALVAVVCAIGLGWSAMISRSAGATALTYVSVVVLGIISPLVTALGTPFVVDHATVRIWGLPPQVQREYDRQLEEFWNQNPQSDGSDAPAPPIGRCAWFERTEEVARTERLWWILVPNPFVIVADAAPLPDGASANLSRYVGQSGDLLAGMRLGVRSLALGPEVERDECIQLYYGLNYDVDWNEDGTPRVTTSDGTVVPVASPVRARTISAAQPLWPWGLGMNLLIGAAFLWVAVRRLAIPYGKLPRGVRVA